MDIAQIAELLNYDPETGVFTWRHSGKKVGSVQVSTCKSKKYIHICRAGKTFKGHRIAFQIMTGRVPDIVDHVDGDGTNNAWLNIRPSTPTENQRNRKLNRNSSTGFTGVCKVRNGKYQAYIKVNRVNKYLGIFEKLEDAISARKSANALFGFENV